MERHGTERRIQENENEISVFRRDLNQRCSYEIIMKSDFRRSKSCAFLRKNESRRENNMKKTGEQETGFMRRHGILRKHRVQNP